MLEGDDAVDFVDDEEWICDHAECPQDGQKLWNRCDCVEVVTHFEKHDKKPIVLLSFDFFLKQAQKNIAVVPKEWDCREADMRLSGYGKEDWNGTLAFLEEHGYLA